MYIIMYESALHDFPGLLDFPRVRGTQQMPQWMAMRHQASVMLVKGHIQTTEVSQLDPEPRSQKGGRMGGGGILKVAAPPPPLWLVFKYTNFWSPLPSAQYFFQSSPPFRCLIIFGAPLNIFTPPPLVILNELSLIHNFRSLFSPYPGTLPR